MMRIWTSGLSLVFIFCQPIAAAPKSKCIDLVYDLNHEKNPTQKLSVADPNSLRIQIIGSEESVRPGVAKSNMVTGQFNINRASFEGRQFVFELGYQYSTKSDKKRVLIPSVALPVTIRINNSYLEVAIDRSILNLNLTKIIDNPSVIFADFASNDVVSRYPIKRLDENTVTVGLADTRLFITGKMADLLDILKDHWIRNAHIQSGGDLLMQESSVRLKDGSVIEVLESLFPKDYLKPGSQFKKISLDASQPMGDGKDRGNPIQDRFSYNYDEGFVVGSEAKTFFAPHFDISVTETNPTGTIDFYATRSVPSDYLTAIGSAVEGYNRYFLKFKGINRSVIRFLGYLPKDVVPGDTRYNVVSFIDPKTRNAIEGFTFDFSTGRIIHAGINIGLGFIRATQRVAENHVYENVNLVPGQEAKNIRELVKLNVMAITLHEMGHLLGMGHNRRSSTMIDLNEGPEQPNKIISAMDELPLVFSTRAFNSVDSFDGPLFEWDRQFLSVLYNNGNDVDFSKPALTVAHDLSGKPEGTAAGIDPLNGAYDFGAKPWEMLQFSIARLENKRFDNWVTASEALENAQRLVLSVDKVKNIKTKQEFEAALNKLKATFLKVLDHYYYIGDISVASSTLAITRFFRKFREGTLDPGTSELQIHHDAMEQYKSAIELRTLPETLSDTHRELVKKSMAMLSKSPYIRGLTPRYSASLLSQKTKELITNFHWAETSENGLLAYVRAYGIRCSGYNYWNNKKASPPYYVEKLPDGTVVDYREAVINLLKKVITSDTWRTERERQAAIDTLKSFQ